MYIQKVIVKVNSVGKRVNKKKKMTSDEQMTKSDKVAIYK